MFKISQQLSQQRSGPTSQCQVSRSAAHQLQTHWSIKPSWLHCHHQGWTCVTCQMMSSCSHQTSGHQETHSTSSKLFSQHHVLQVPRVKEPSGGHVLNWKIHQSLQDAIYHMIYLTVAHCVRHGSPASSSDLSTVYKIVSGVMLPGHLQHFEEEDLYGIKSFNLKSHAPGHLRLSSFMDQLQLFRAFTPLLGSSGGPSQLMANHVLYYESVSISDRYVSQSLSCIISHRTARLNERVHALMRQHHPHSLMVYFQSSLGHEMEFKHSVTEFTVKPSFFIESLVTSPHLEGLDQMASPSMQISSPSSFNAQPSSSLMVKSAVINIR